MTALMTAPPVSAPTARRSAETPLAASVLTLVGGVAVLPPALQFTAVQADERHPGYRHLLLPQARFARPRGLGKHTDEEALRLAPTGPSALRIAAPGQSLSDLAVDAALDLRDQLGSGQIAQTTHVVVASAALNETIGDSVVGRVQYELGLKDVLPLALGQNGTLGWYSALMLLDGLLGENDQALLVLADKWLYPFFRHFGDLVGYSDGASAVLVRRTSANAQPQAQTGAWGTLKSVIVQYGTSFDDPWGCAPDSLRDALAPLAARAILRALDQAQLRADQIDWCVPPGIDPAFAARVADAAAIPLARRVHREAAGHGSSADSPTSLLQLGHAASASAHGFALVWDVALHGAAAAAVFDLSAGALDAVINLAGEPS
jgi:3-oxoacyl-[acyl-carrier-protein] synthase III